MASIIEFIQNLTLADLAVGLFFIGLFGAMTQRNIIKTIIAVGIMDVAAVAFFVSTNHVPGARPPVATAMDAASVAPMADPVPQALMITAIVIGVSVVAMCLAMYLRVMYRYETADWDILIRRLED